MKAVFTTIATWMVLLAKRCNVHLYISIKYATYTQLSLQSLIVIILLFQKQVRSARVSLAVLVTVFNKFFTRTKFRSQLQSFLLCWASTISIIDFVIYIFERSSRLLYVTHHHIYGLAILFYDHLTEIWDELRYHPFLCFKAIVWWGYCVQWICIM